MRLTQKGKLDLDSDVSRYLPWFSMRLNGKKTGITVRQLLFHTSGIPRDSLDMIAAGGGDAALEQTVRRLVNFGLKQAPGSCFEYSTINYDVVGLAVQESAGEDFGLHIVKEVLAPLGLSGTRPDSSEKILGKAQGYKIGFSRARPYNAPYYRGNLPAGYILSNGNDMIRWLRLQLGVIPDPFGNLIETSHLRDESVPPDRNFSSYGLGWKIMLDGSGIIEHSGINPTFTSYIAINPRQEAGVAVLANSNSVWTDYIGRMVLKRTGGFLGELKEPGGQGLDRVCLVFCFMLCIVIVGAVGFLLSIPVDLYKKRRYCEGLGLPEALSAVTWLAALAPILYGVYLVPYALENLSWKTAIVWAPQSFSAACVLFLAAIGLSLPGFLLSAIFPMKNNYYRSLPLIALLSLLSGGANVAVIFLLSSSIFSSIKIQYQLYYFVLAFFIYIVGRKVLQVKLARMTYDIVYDLRMRLLRKIFLTSYQDFEAMDRGRVYATLNDDTGQIGNSANIIVRLITSLVTICGAFLYLMTIAFWATVVTLGMILTIVVIYVWAGRRARILLEEARNTRNVFMGLLNGLLDGFKELSLRANRKKEYWGDIEKSCHEFRSKTVQATIQLINAFIVGESMLLVVLGAIAFGFPRMFPDLGIFTIMSFIMILLYLIGPISAITGAIPEMLQILVCWRRIQGFEKDIPARLTGDALDGLRTGADRLEYVRLKGITFHYKNGNGDDFFKVGPLDFEARKGEITFIVGGNGSGKTTFAKLLTGLYEPIGGTIDFGGGLRSNGNIGEYISVVFSDNYVFEKLYALEIDDRDEQIARYLEMLGLSQKVQIDPRNKRYSTINLSGGQKKRLALLQCYIEDSPVFLFDEIAADQDPQFREFFYRRLLPEMRREGKIVIAITHDDHYFDAADKIIKMEMGRIHSIQKL